MEDHKLMIILKGCFEKQSQGNLDSKDKEILIKIFNKINSVLWYQEKINSVVTNHLKNNK
jgi:hypothetical protein